MFVCLFVCLCFVLFCALFLFCYVCFVVFICYIFLSFFSFTYVISFYLILSYLFYSILFYSILFYSILFYSILFGLIIYVLSFVCPFINYALPYSLSWINNYFFLSLTSDILVAASMLNIFDVIIGLLYCHIFHNMFCSARNQ